MKILENNGTQIENIDDASFHNFLSGNQSGIVKGILNECNVYQVNSREIRVSTGMLLIKGVRIKLLNEIRVTIPENSLPANSTRYRYLVKVVLRTDKFFDVSFFSEEVGSNRTLIQEDLYKIGQGTYELELFRYTIDPSQGYIDLQRTVDVIFDDQGGSASGFEIGEVKTKTLGIKQKPEVDIENVVDPDGNVKTNFTFSFPDVSYLDDSLKGKVPITPDGFPATYAGLFGKTSAGKIEIVNKTSYWDNVENYTNYNCNGSVAGYSHRATGENVLYTGTPDMPSQAANKLYVDDGLSGKLDKATAAYGGFNLYGTKYNDPTTQMWLIDNGDASQSKIPMYYESTNPHITTHANGGVLVTSTPLQPVHAANKKYVDDISNGKVDKVTTAYKIYGTDGSGNQKVYPTGWSASSGLFQIMDHTPNGGYNDDGSFSSGATGTYMVAIPKKPSHATPKKWVEDNFTIYKHLIQLDMGEGHPSHEFNVLSTRSTPYTNASELPKNEIFTIVDNAFEQVQFVKIYGDKYVSGIEYDYNINKWKYIDGTASGFFTIASDTVVKA